MELRNLYYDVEGTTLSLPAAEGPFSFPIEADRRSEVRVAVLARSVEGCVSQAERVIRFDTSKWIELVQGEGWADVTVDAPGKEFVVHWKAKVKEDVTLRADVSESISRRSVPLEGRGTSRGEGFVNITVQNEDLELWQFNLGIEPAFRPLAISVGPALQMIPARIDLGVGESQWISIPNARSAVWTVEPAAVLESEEGGSWGTRRAGARFEAQRPGTYKVRATSSDGARIGDALLEVKSIERPTVSISDLPPFPEGFRPIAVAALPDGTLAAGGHFDFEPALVRLPRGGDSWTTFADVRSESRVITHLVADEGGDLFALSDAVLRISPDGAIERILDSEVVSESIEAIWSAGGTLFATVGWYLTHAFDPATGAWTNLGLMGACPDTAAASNDQGVWLTCRGQDRLRRPDLSVPSLGP
ncbi:MAG TPA: hypothetical protein VGD74_04500, partial [Vulgatibacter sp.]